MPSQTSRYVLRGYYFIMRNGVSQKRATLEELSNNISERRVSKANEPVSEQSERASGYTLGFATKRAQRG